MTRLLISVKNAAEARDALLGGADLIDVKDPSRGALGAACPSVWQEVSRVVHGKCPMSVALGELRDYTLLDNDLFPEEVQFAKLGLAGCVDQSDWTARWEAAIEALPNAVTPVGVIYADQASAHTPNAQQIITQAAKARCAFVLIDTYEKNGKDLFATMPEEDLRSVIRYVRSFEMKVVLGGSLNEHSLPRAVHLAPDFVAFRGAVCAGQRTSSVDRLRVRRLARQLADR